MKYITFTIPIPDIEDQIEEINRFISSHRIISINKECVMNVTQPYWTFLLEYISDSKKNAGDSYSRKPKVDYKEVLSEEDFAVFSSLRDLRKELAAEEGKPVYALFTNEQLASIVLQKIVSKTALGKIDGIGKDRVDKYGEKITEYLKDIYGTIKNVDKPKT